MQRKQYKVIGVGVHMYFSNIRGRTSRQIYRLALALSAPETLSTLSKFKNSLFNAHLALA